MLRITREGDAGSPCLKIEGRLEGPWVEVLRQTWRESAIPSRGQKLTVDLSAVSFANPEGRALLLEMRGKGVVLARVSEFMRRILLADSGDDSDRKGE